MLLAADSPIFVITKRERSLLDYCAGAGIGRMLDTRQPDGVSTAHVHQKSCRLRRLARCTDGEQDRDIDLCRAVRPAS